MGTPLACAGADLLWSSPRDLPWFAFVPPGCFGINGKIIQKNAGDQANSSLMELSGPFFVGACKLKNRPTAL